MQQNITNLTLWLFRKLSELSDAIYRIKLASLDSDISKVFCHILAKNFLVRSSVPTQKGKIQQIVVLWMVMLLWNSLQGS